jgi:RNA-directed DNA polymerase
VNTDESELTLFRAERRVREIQAKLHRWARDDPHRRFDDLFNLAAPRKRLVISPVKPGGTRREVPGSDG